MYVACLADSVNIIGFYRPLSHFFIDTAFFICYEAPQSIRSICNDRAMQYDGPIFFVRYTLNQKGGRFPCFVKQLKKVLNVSL